MKFQCFLLCTLITSVLSSTYKRIISFGDNYSDNGNYFKLLNHTSPLFYNGRLTNGNTWLDYLKTDLVANLTSYAYIKATSNNELFNVDSTLKIPGCKQQVNKFKQDFQHYKHLNQTLITFNFGGNELILPDSQPNIIIQELETCLTDLLNLYPFNTILLSTSTIIDLLPVIQAIGEPFESFIRSKVNIFNQLYSQSFIKLQQKYNKINLIEDHFRDFWLLTLTNTTLNTKDSCFDKDKKCVSANNYFYWDNTHPTTRIHRLIAEDALNYIKKK
ncbi:hypothetical protein K502DRAFT_353701 [Neoconidiobolus thromboides FSU 785]|nr:hypothetical protein K502DRAFT_353701 [Neoconidiobolus thromboides FSU 785]